MDLINALNWRYATKRMIDRKVSQKDLDTIKETISLTPSAYGLQPYKVIVTENKELLQKIHQQACPQLVIEQCSHLLIFKAMKTVSAEYLEEFLQEMKTIRNSSDEYIDGYREKINYVLQNPQIDIFRWTTKQAYIALGFAMVAAAELKIDATPIEGFNPDALNKLLNLDTSKEETVVLLTLGYRDEAEDHLANVPKIRKPLSELIEAL
ncbi:MAG: putative nitroreductase [Bacteroidetes bacterium]|nr:putative nitroreductase [Bacteroidota bacterium]